MSVCPYPYDYPFECFAITFKPVIGGDSAQHYLQFALLMSFTSGGLHGAPSATTNCLLTVTAMSQEEM